MKEQRLLNIILGPHISEKSTIASGNNQYVFRVVNDAKKNEIKEAVQLLFGVEVVAVQVSNVKPYNVVFGRREGKRKGWKKAYVKVAQGKTIDFTGAQA